MKRFWKWMIKNEYCDQGNGILNWTEHMPFTKQMLIGYMIGYLMKKLNKNSFYNLMTSWAWDDLDDTNQLYECLEREINNL